MAETSFVVDLGEAEIGVAAQGEAETSIKGGKV